MYALAGFYFRPFDLLWLLFALVWAIGAWTSKRTVQREAMGGRIVQACLLALAFLLLFEPWRFSRINVRFVPDSSAIPFFGFLLTAAGLAFAIWARLTLGRNWSGTVTIKQDHQLILEGAYRRVRHPIYVGVLLAMVGTAIGYGRAPCLIGIPVAFLAFWRKSRTEERFMTAQFGAEYTRYQREVKGFIPGCCDIGALK